MSDPMPDRIRRLSKPGSGFLSSPFPAVIAAILLAASVLAPAGCAREGNSRGEPLSYAEMDPPAAAEFLKTHAGDPNFVLLDIRTPEEYESERIEGSVNIDFYQPDFRKRIAALDKNKTYLVYCRTGRRSGQSLPIFKELGFRKVSHLSHGITAWKQDGLPVVGGGPR